MQILSLTSFAAALDLRSALSATQVSRHVVTADDKEDPPEVMDGINQFRAEQCADRPEPWKHKDCMDFMKKACNPSGADGTEGTRPQMNNEEGEITTGKGFCKKFFNAQKEEEEKKPDDRIPKLEEELKKSEEELKKAQDELEDCQNKYHELELKCAADKKKLEDELEAAQKEIEELKKKLANRKDDLQDALTTTLPPTTTTTSTTAPIIKKQIADTKRVAGLPLYKPPDFEGDENEEEGWDYLENGKNWPSMCQETEGQSPVDITRDIDIQGQTKFILWCDYYADPDREQKKISSYLVNHGHGITFQPPENLDLGYIKLYKSQYTCKDYTFHSPSEHTLDGARFPLEIQIMNKDRDSDKQLGIALFFREGKTSNTFIAALMEAAGDAPRWNMAASAKTVNRAVRDAFDLNLLVPKSEQHPGGHLTFYNYEGSLTSPPCTKGVDWWVGAKPLSATKDEIRYIQQAILESPSTRHGNNRETQPLNGRTVKVGMTNFQDAVKMPGYHDNADSVQEPRGFSTQDSPW